MVERWIGQVDQAVKMTRLSCHRFRANQMRLWPRLIVHNLGNLMVVAHADRELLLLPDQHVAQVKAAIAKAVMNPVCNDP